MLDVGAASGDVALAVKRRFPQAEVCSLDLRAFHIAQAPEPRVVGSAKQLPFRPHAFDFVFCSLLLHEFRDVEVVRLLQRFYAVASRALVVLDLYRHPIPYHFLPVTQKVFGWGDVTVHDGPVSVEAGFLPSELEALAGKAGIQRVSVVRHLPWFRISLVADHE
jgi:SAM-dependent methyltransferase